MGQIDICASQTEGLGDRLQDTLGSRTVNGPLCHEDDQHPVLASRRIT